MFYDKNKKTGIDLIITINVILFIPWLILFVLNDGFLLKLLMNYFGLNINVLTTPVSINTGAYWQVLTGMFVHGGLWHLVFNMYGLYIFGKPLEYIWGKRVFLSYYIITGVLANIASVFFFLYLKSPVVLIGASGAVFAVLLAFAAYYPDVELLLFFVIPMKVKWAVLLFTGIELFSQISSISQGIAHITHLFGFLFGFIYLLLVFRVNAFDRMFKKY